MVNVDLPQKKKRKSLKPESLDESEGESVLSLKEEGADTQKKLTNW